MKTFSPGVIPDRTGEHARHTKSPLTRYFHRTASGGGIIALETQMFNEYLRMNA